MTYPALACPLVDGVRCLIVNGVPVGRNLLPWPNRSVRDILSNLPPMDGVIVVGSLADKAMPKDTMEALCSPSAVPKFTYWVFDCVTQKPMPLEERLPLIQSYVASSGKRVKYIGHKIVKNLKEFQEYEAQMILAGNAGAAFRDLALPYSMDDVPYTRDDSRFIGNGGTKR